MTTLAETPATVASIVVDCAVATAAMEILKVTEVAPDGMVTEEGITTAELLLDKLTTTPAPVAGPVKDTAQLSEAAPTTAVFVHWMLCREAVAPPPDGVLPFLTVTAPQPEKRIVASRRAANVHTKPAGFSAQERNW